MATIRKKADTNAMQRVLPYIVYLFSAIFAGVFLYACANIASPTGGAYDIDPPVVRRATPAFNALNVSKTVVEIEFDENIKVEKPTEKVIITPPQQNMPVIKAVGRKAVVELNDELLPGTTYTIDFTDAIVDNNEGNPIENFVYQFSTGEQLDTMAISGRVLNAEDLEPVTGIYVGVHSNLNDTAFTKVMFERISRTDSRGNFTVRGMSPGNYKVYVLNDLNRDYKYDNPQESIAFLDSVVVPSTMPAVRQDTIFNPKDSTQIDTVKTIHYTRFLPDDLLLRSFLSDFQRRYLQKHERPEAHKLQLFFAAPTLAPSFRLLQPDGARDDWYVQERSAENDSITLWITDSLVYGQDSIRMQLNYARTDSLNRDYIATDTLAFNLRRTTERRQQRNRGDEEEPQVRFLGVNTNIQSTFEVFNPIRIEFEQPILSLDSADLRLTREVDSMHVPVPFRLLADSLNPRKFTVRHPWEPGGKYNLSIDSATVTSHYGLWNNTLNQNFTVKALDQYGNLEISISGLPSDAVAYVVLLDKSDKPFRKTQVKASVARFQDLAPGTHYARMFIDENGDGVWTTGNFEKKRQPETVYYYPRTFEIRAYSDHFESWNVAEMPVIRQKPLEITKNKPQERKQRNPNLERERERQQQQQQNRQNPAFSGMGGGRSLQQQSGMGR